jgi:selenium metabolism protein YedF
MVEVDARGDACPIPVVKTKQAAKEVAGAGEIRTLVDNEIAVQNLTKMAVQKGWGVRSSKLDDNNYEVITSIGAGEPDQQKEAEEVCIPDGRTKKTVVVISADTMGQGNDELGHVLIKSFLYALTQQDELPAAVLFYNTGAKLTCEGSASLDDIKSLEAMGVEIMTCGTCLDFQNLKEKLAVGGVTNMYEIAERLLTADHVVRP